MIKPSRGCARINSETSAISKYRPKLSEMSPGDSLSWEIVEEIIMAFLLLYFFSQRDSDAKNN
jgi:hypothetical protein